MLYCFLDTRSWSFLRADSLLIDGYSFFTCSFLFIWMPRLFSPLAAVVPLTAVPVWILKGRLLYFYQHGAYTEYPQVHTRLWLCWVKAYHQVTRASQLPQLLSYQCSYPPAVPCLGSNTHFSFSVFVCVDGALDQQSSVWSECVSL